MTTKLLVLALLAVSSHLGAHAQDPCDPTVMIDVQICQIAIETDLENDVNVCGRIGDLIQQGTECEAMVIEAVCLLEDFPDLVSLQDRLISQQFVCDDTALCDTILDCMEPLNTLGASQECIKDCQSAVTTAYNEAKTCVDDLPCSDEEKTTFIEGNLNTGKESVMSRKECSAEAEMCDNFCDMQEMYGNCIPQQTGDPDQAPLYEVLAEYCSKEETEIQCALTAAGECALLHDYAFSTLSNRLDNAQRLGCDLDINMNTLSPVSDCNLQMALDCYSGQDGPYLHVESQTPVPWFDLTRQQVCDAVGALGYATLKTCVSMHTSGCPDDLFSDSEMEYAEIRLQYLSASGVDGLENYCSSDCESIDEEAIKDCHNGINFADGTCAELKEYAKCIKPLLGNCDILKSTVAQFVKGIRRLSARMDDCNANLGIDKCPAAVSAQQEKDINERCMGGLRSGLQTQQQVCGAFGSYPDCVEHFGADCPLLVEKYTKFLEMDFAVIDKVFGCQLLGEDAEGLDATGCQYERVLACYNVLVDAASVPRLTYRLPRNTTTDPWPTETMEALVDPRYFLTQNDGRCDNVVNLKFGEFQTCLNGHADTCKLDAQVTDWHHDNPWSISPNKFMRAKDDICGSDCRPVADAREDVDKCFNTHSIESCPRARWDANIGKDDACSDVQKLHNCGYDAAGKCEFLQDQFESNMDEKCPEAKAICGPDKPTKQLPTLPTPLSGNAIHHSMALLVAAGLFAIGVRL